MENTPPYEKLMQALEAYFQEQSPVKLQTVRDAHAHCRREERKFGVEAVLEDEDEDNDDGDSPLPDDLCDVCMSSEVSVERTTYCGKTIGIECGCDDDQRYAEGYCGDPACEDCNAERESSADEEDDTD